MLSSTVVLVLCAIFLRVSARTLQEENTSDRDISENMVSGGTSLNHNLNAIPQQHRVYCQCANDNIKLDMNVNVVVGGDNNRPTLQHGNVKFGIDEIIVIDEISDNNRPTPRVTILETSDVTIHQRNSESKNGTLEETIDTIGIVTTDGSNIVSKTDTYVRIGENETNEKGDGSQDGQIVEIIDGTVDNRIEENIDDRLIECPVEENSGDESIDSRIDESSGDDHIEKQMAMFDYFLYEQ